MRGSEPEFAHGDPRRRPVRSWTSFGLPCHLYWGFTSLNGYVRLPRAARSLNTAQLGAFVHVHGGVTYGPDAFGWIGWDTGHAGDRWTPEELARVFPGGVPIEVRRRQRVTQRMYAIFDTLPYANEIRQEWTIEAMIRETDDMALVIAEQYLAILANPQD